MGSSSISKIDGKSVDSSVENVRDVQFYGGYHSESPDQNPQKDSNCDTDSESEEEKKFSPLTVEGICLGTDAPSYFVRWHVRGSIDYNLRKVGTFEDPIGPDGTHIGYWKKEKTVKNTVLRTVAIRLFGQDIECLYRHGNATGKESMSLYPGSIYVDPRAITDPNDIKPYFIERAEYIAKILRATGWQVTDPVFKGKVHYATHNAELLQHFRHNVQIEGAEVITDTSDSKDEVEMEDIESDPRAKAKAEVMAFLPTRILAAEANIENNTNEIATQRMMLDDMQNTMDGIMSLLKSHNNALVVLTENENKAIEVLTGIEGLLIKQENLSQIQIRINSNLISNISKGNQHTLDTFVGPLEDSDKSKETKLNHTTPEGYQ